jgi:Tfp pilus assembly protein PilF
MGIKELSLELAAVSMIADEAKKAKDRLRAALQAEMDNIGADRVKAEYPRQCDCLCHHNEAEVQMGYQVQ